MSAKVYPNKGMTDVRAFYNGTSLTMRMESSKVKAFFATIEKANDAISSHTTEEVKELMDGLEETICAYAQRIGQVKFLGSCEHDVLKGAFPTNTPKEMLGLWFSCVAVLLKRKVIDNDNDNGWLMTARG